MEKFKYGLLVFAGKMKENSSLGFSATLNNYDLDAMIELNLNSGMAFHDDSERESYFHRIESCPREVEYGAALAHAKATNLGIWGSDRQLYEDCAQIMAAELRRCQQERGHVVDVTKELVIYSWTFQKAYDIMRHPKEAAIHDFVRSLGNNHMHMQRKAIAHISDVELQKIGAAIYAHILKELIYLRQKHPNIF